MLYVSSVTNVPRGSATSAWPPARSCARGRRVLSIAAVCALLSCIAAGTAPGAARAGNADPKDSGVVISVGVKEEVSVTDERGNVKIVHREVLMADPGDVLVYTLTYKNVGKHVVKDAVVNDAVPEGTILLPGSVLGEKATVSFSIDGGKSFVAFPARLQVAGMGGTPVEKPAPPEAYTHIRWTARAPLAPGESRTASFKVIVR